MSENNTWYKYQIDLLNHKINELKTEKQQLLNTISELQKELYYYKEKKGE